MMIYIISVLTVLLIIMSLVTLLYLVEKNVIGSSDCKVVINGDEEKSPTVSSGTTLLSALSNNGLFLPSACGGLSLIHI